MGIKSPDLPSLERKLSILSSHYGGMGSVRITLSPETDSTLYVSSRKTLFLGIRFLIGRPDLPEILRLMVIHELGILRLNSPECSDDLFSIPTTLRTLMEEYRSDSFQRDLLGMAPEEFAPMYNAVFPLRVRRKRLAINNLRRSVDPYVLGEQVLNRSMGGHQRFPHERFPILTRIFIIVTRYRFFGRYQEFLGDWKSAMELGRSARTQSEFLTIGWEFHEKWKTIFDRSKDSGRKASGSAPSAPQTQSGGAGSGGFAAPSLPSTESGEAPPWDYRAPETTHGFGSEGANVRKHRLGSGGNGLGASLDDEILLRMFGEIPFFHPPVPPREVFPWDQHLIRLETKSLARFLKTGREDLPVAGLTGRLVAQRVFQPTLKVMNRPSPFREGGRELRILAIVDYSFSMDGWPHYYASHLIQVIHRSGIASSLDVIASSSRFYFRMNPDDLNLLQPDEMEGFQNLLPMIDRSGFQYDAAVVLTDCQISERSARALEELRKKVLTIGCYVVPEEVQHVRGRPIEMVIDDGRAMFPSTFLYSDTFHGLGRRLALTLNRMKHRDLS